MYTMDNNATLDITEIMAKHRRVMQRLESLRDDDVEKHRKTFLRIATPSRTHLDSGDIGYFHARINSAETVKDLSEVFLNYFFRLTCDELNFQAQRNPLLKVLNHTSGDNIEGMPMRRIETIEMPSGFIRVSNIYHNDIKTDLFAKEDFVKLCQNNALPYVAYGREFLKAAKRDPEISRLLEQAEAEKSRPMRDAARLQKQQALRNHLRRR